MTAHDDRKDADDTYPSLPEGATVTLLTPELALLVLPLPQARIPEQLTPHEREIALAIYEGLNAEDIAQRRSISVKTVGNHLNSIYRKLGVSSRFELLLELRRSDSDGAPAPCDGLRRAANKAPPDGPDPQNTD